MSNKLYSKNAITTFGIIDSIWELKRYVDKIDRRLCCSSINPPTPGDTPNLQAVTDIGSTASNFVVLTDASTIPSGIGLSLGSIGGNSYIYSGSLSTGSANIPLQIIALSTTITSSEDITINAGSDKIVNINAGGSSGVINLNANSVTLPFITTGLLYNDSAISRIANGTEGSSLNIISGVPTWQIKEKHGFDTLNFDGVQDTFTISHNLGVIPSTLLLTFGNTTDTNVISNIKTVDASNITISYATTTPPSPGSTIVYWQVIR